jgi:hypothetical protein
MYIEKKHILFFIYFIIPLFFTLKTSKYCDRGKKDQHKNQERNIHSIHIQNPTNKTEYM